MFRKSLIFITTAALGLSGAVLAGEIYKWTDEDGSVHYEDRTHRFGKADLTMALNGALAGLVAITAEPLTPEPIQAMLIAPTGSSILSLSSITIEPTTNRPPTAPINIA